MPSYYSNRVQDHINEIEPSSAGQVVAVPFELVIPAGSNLVNDDDLYLVKIPPGCSVVGHSAAVVADIDSGTSLRVNMGLYNADESVKDEDAFATAIDVDSPGFVSSIPDAAGYLGVTDDDGMIFGWKVSAAASTTDLTSNGRVRGWVLFATAHP